MSRETRYPLARLIGGIIIISGGMSVAFFIQYRKIELGVDTLFTSRLLALLFVGILAVYLIWEKVSVLIGRTFRLDPRFCRNVEASAYIPLVLLCSYPMVSPFLSHDVSRRFRYFALLILGMLFLVRALLVSVYVFVKKPPSSPPGKMFRFRDAILILALIAGLVYFQLSSYASYYRLDERPFSATGPATLKYETAGLRYVLDNGSVKRSYTDKGIIRNGWAITAGQTIRSELKVPKGAVFSFEFAPVNWINYESGMHITSLHVILRNEGEKLWDDVIQVNNMFPVFQTYEKRLDSLTGDTLSFEISVGLRKSVSQILFHPPWRPFLPPHFGNLVMGVTEPSITLPRSEARPNLILISLDTLRADHLGVYGYERETSPHIDSFADESCVFENAYANSTWTLPSHVTMFTSLYSYTHQMDSPPKTCSTLPFTTFVEEIRKNHYHTGGFVGSGYVSSHYGLNKGFDEFVEEPAIEKIIPHIKDWIEKKEGSSFFAFIHTYCIHDFFYALEKYRSFIDYEYNGAFADGFKDRLDTMKQEEISASAEDIRFFIDLYDGAIKYTDAILGEFFAFLKERDIYDKTIIIITSDHGEAFGEYHDYRVSSDEEPTYQDFFHGGVPFQAKLGIPLIVKTCGSLSRAKGLSSASGKRIATEVSVVDLAPTILDMLNIEIPADFQGVSLANQLKGSPRYDGRAVFFGSSPYAGIIDGDKKVIRKRSLPNWTLYYDLGDDPAEQRNLSDVAPDHFAGSFERMGQHLNRQEKAASSMVHIEEKPLSEELEKQLKALGYLN